MKDFQLFLENKRQVLIQNAVQKIESAIGDLKAIGLPSTFGEGIDNLQQIAGNLKFAGGLVVDEPNPQENDDDPRLPWAKDQRGRWPGPQRRF